jgi:hypothetical protein
MVCCSADGSNCVWSHVICRFLNTSQHTLLLPWRRAGIAAAVLKSKLQPTVAWNFVSVVESSFYENSSALGIKSEPIQAAAGYRRQLNALSLRHHLECARGSTSCKTSTFTVIVQSVQLGQSLQHIYRYCSDCTVRAITVAHLPLLFSLYS